MSFDLASSQMPSGWQDDRLMQAYDLIWEVQQARKNFGMNRDFGAILDKIEVCDELIKEIILEQGE